MSTRKWISAVIGCSLALCAHASKTHDHHPWSFIGSLGYTWYNDLYDGGSSAGPFAQSAIGDGQTALGRFAIARDLGGYKSARFGLEVGVQSGNTARLAISQATIDEVGGVLPQVTIKPILDLLATATWQPVEHVPVYAMIKPGIAYRRLQVNDRVTFNDLSEVAFELQVGLGGHISDRANLSLNYQGIFTSDTTYTINSTTGTGEISNIPMQNGLLLSLSYSV